MRFPIFGQELYLEESIRAIEQLQDTAEADGVAARIAELLPHPAESTRLRVASKIIQRYFKSADGKSPAAPFLKLVKGLRSESARRDLLYWRAARTDRIIAAIAADIFYPYFVLNAVPDGYGEAAFHRANTATLFEVDRVITTDFAADYARKIWRFDSARTVRLALRIMKQAQILDAVSVKLGRRHVLGYYPQPHSLQPEVFAYCLCEEFLDADSDSSPTLDRLYNGDCTKLFFLNRLQVDSLLKSLARKKLIEYATQSGGRHIRLASPNLQSLVASILGR